MIGGAEGADSVRAWKAKLSEVSNPVVKVAHALSNVTVRQYGDTAILTGLDTAKAPGSPDDVEATTVVWVRQSGKWLIAVAQWSEATATK